ncbi:hypothetical protein BDB00DRAFT_846468 [Zychaea mexicana]|uniref:uncharacterized protein n=1 Tax=Zychaea mexicana TaxID=64656 RepID=UPI0022FF4325|nr:uncharacterized protein BDB00DRAFT_846468 [Zychaea mexicana]KAI9488872.1 hypothetical protein BDB00DRAFT_846468 [Zychaea mexicana]
MSNSASSASQTESPGLAGVLSGPLSIPGYHFKSLPTQTLAHGGENVDVVCGYKISNKNAVVAKVSCTSSLRLEREFYIMKRLYQYADGPLYIVRPLEYLNLPSGLTVAIYADEGRNYLFRRTSDETPELSATYATSTTSVASDNASSIGSSSNGSSNSNSNLGAWAQYQHMTNIPSYHPTAYDGPSNDVAHSLTPHAYDLGTFLRFAIMTTECLEFIHRHTIHGEVRPSAFQWSGSDNDRVKLWNFGSGSKSYESFLTSEGWRKTATSKESMHMLQSLLVYMSPEQTGRTTYAPDHRSDIYSLGIIFFFLLTGRPPFNGGPLEILNGILSRKVPLVHELQLDVPDVVSRIIEKMTNKAPDDRYSSAHGVQFDLKECLKRLKESERSSEVIPSFPLAQHDIASVFTLPKTIYGRHHILSEMTYIIERHVNAYRTALARTRERSTQAASSNAGPSVEILNGSNGGAGGINTIDTYSDTSAPESADHGPKSTASPSYCSGLDGSDVSSSTSRAVQNTNARQSTTMVAVYGPGGIGKSTLFNAAQATARQHGYVAAIKFDSKNKVPYSGILKSLSQVLQQILSESEEEIKHFYDYLKTSLDSQFISIELLADLVPELKPLLDPQQIAQKEVLETIHMDNVETQSRFHTLFMEVFRAINNWRLTTLFLDDLHQADEPSLELLESMMSSRVNILVFVNYRDKEVSGKLEQFLNNNAANMHFIKVDPLSFDSLTDLICDTLHRPRDVNRDDVKPLADAIYKRTSGNAFYTAQLLRTLERKKLIFFNWEENEWDYNLHEIQQAAMYNTDNISSDSPLNLSFLVARLRELPHEGQLLLKWASFVGDTFSWSTVKSLMLASDPEDSTSDTGSMFSEESEDTAKGDTTPVIESTNASSSKDKKGDNSSITTTTTDPSEAQQQEQGQQQQVVAESLHPLIQFTHTIQDDSLDVDSSGNQSPALRPRSSSPRRSKRSSPASSASSSTARDPIHGLQAVLQEGYIMPIQSDEFKWSHDRISQAAMELANPKTRSKIHFKIARFLMKEKNMDTFLVADHLLKCPELILALSVDERVAYRRLMIQAGNKGRNSGAHRMSFAYYKAAIEFGDPDSAWTEEEYATTVNLYTNMAALSWVVGEYEMTESLLKDLLTHVRDPIDRSNAYRIEAKYYMSRQRYDKCQQSLHKCLAEFWGRDFEFNTTDEELQREFFEAKAKLDKIGLCNVLRDVKACEDPTFKAASHALEELCTAAYWIGQQREMYYWGCRIINLSLDRGMTSVSGVAFQFMGTAAVMRFKLFSYGEELGAAGVAISDKYGSNFEKGRSYFLYALFLVGWNHHHREALNWYRTAGPISLASGDRIYASFSQVHVGASMFTLGYNLADAVREAESCFEDCNVWSPSSQTNFLSMSVIRTIKALQGQTFYNTPEVFDGDDGFNSQHFIIESCRDSSNRDISMNWYESYKLIPLVLYGHTDVAIETGYRCVDTMYLHPCHKHTRLMLFYFSLALISKMRQNISDEDRAKLRERVKTNQELLHEWAINTPVNYMMYWLLVEAERVSLGNAADIAKASRLYEEALDIAREGAWFLELCVINEYAGAFYERIGMRNIAYNFIKKAVNLYMDHGSYGKARQLSSNYVDLLEKYNDNRTEYHDSAVQTDPFPFLGPQASWSTSSYGPSVAAAAAVNEPYVSESIPPVTTESTLLTLDILDMASILKSSQVMSSEVKFDSLLSSMMGIILENSGAERGALIVKEEKFGVCAYGSQNAETITYDPPRRLFEDDELVSSRIINHTIHTGESIFIHNIEEDTRFAVGPWFERTGSKSVICMPIIHKGALAGCLFIEGSVGVFTQRHVTVLSLLCQQMGISITNAFLFKSVQRATMANMRMIEMQKQALEDARKSKEAAVRATRLREIFLANMSHEIRTPFSGFYGMISLLAETNLDPEQRDLVKTAKESCEILLQIIDDLLNFSKLQAGKVSLDLSPVVVEQTITDVIEMLIAMAIQKKVNVTYNVTKDVPSVVMADANRLRQILINLLGNAIKFTHEGEIEIRCTINKRASKKAGDDKVALLFEVVDTGIGISEEQRKVLFAPFSQVDGSTTRKYGGTGLGLSICLQLVELMTGTIDVSSQPSKGSNFYFTIQVNKVQDQTLERNNTIATLLNELKDCRVLISAKHASTVKMVRQLLPGITVDGVCSATELASHKDTTYQALIIGLFLTHDPDYSAWADNIRYFLDRTRCIIIMHYPSSGVCEFLGQNHLTLGEEDGRPTLLDTTTAKSKAQRQQRLEPSPQQKRAVVRMAVPLRRQKLLLTMIDMLRQTEEAPPTPRPTLRASPSSRDGAKLSGDAITPEERKLFSTMRVLVAEDNPVAQKLVFKQLTRLGFHVDCANNGLEAVEKWMQHPPGYYIISFFDHHMPQCDGVEATKKIRKIEAQEARLIQLPIVALTADVQDSARKICLNAAMNEYLTKPMNHKVLAETLRRFCCNSNSNNYNNNSNSSKSTSSSNLSKPS